MNRRPTYRTSVLALVLLFIYLINPVKLSLPYLDYKVNYEYIVAFLCENKDKPELHCDGKCYLSKAIKSSQESSEDHQKLIPKNFFADELLTDEIVIVNSAKSISKSNSPYFYSFQIVFSQKTTPPPRSIS